MPSFDIVSEVDKQEIRNATDQVNKEVRTRFDFKGSDARVPEALRRKEESLAVQSIVLTTGRIVGFAITFAIPVVLVRVLDQSTFGV